MGDLPLHQPGIVVLVWVLLGVQAFPRRRLMSRLGLQWCVAESMVGMAERAK
jgi:hypothetical protein